MGSVILFGSYIGLDPLTYILSGDQNRNHPLFFLAVTHPKCGILKYHSDVGWGDQTGKIFLRVEDCSRIDFPQMY